MSEAYFCEKCGYIGKTQEHPSCEYLAIDLHWQEKKIATLTAKLEAAEKERDKYKLAMSKNADCIREQAAQIEVLKKSVDSLVNFVTAVAPRSSYWEEVYPKLEAAAREVKS